MGEGSGEVCKGGGEGLTRSRVFENCRENQACGLAGLDCVGMNAGESQRWTLRWPGCWRVKLY